MDWIRLGNSGKDLTGVGAKAGRLSVTSKELANHDKEDDCWLAIRGKVYNVTEYLPFHPGGVEEIMKGAGKDATAIFDQVHAWVNYESILQKCVVGRLVSIDPSINREDLFLGKDSFIVPKTSLKTPSLLKTPTNSPKENPQNTKETPLNTNESLSIPTTPLDDSLPLPRFDWIQKLNSITVIFYTGAFSNPCVEITPPTAENEVNVVLTYLNTCFTNELKLLQKVLFPPKIKVYCETGKVELVFNKISSEIWDNYGILRQNSDKITPGSDRTAFVLAEKTQVNHNTYLLKFDRTNHCRYIVPIGKHVRIFMDTQGTEISRSYTSVPDSLFTNFGPKNETSDSLCLMVKRYQHGILSQYITDLKMGDTLYTSRPLGNFKLQRLEKLDKFILLAAGTGITPMLSLIVFLLERRIKKCQSIALLFFNRRKEDIIFEKQLTDLSETDKRLRIDHVLSDAEESWQGLRGHVNASLLNSTIQKDLKDSIYTTKDMFVCVCGPNAFNDLAEKLLVEIGFSADQLHCFQG
ncbi:unnamed protein product [Brassicogethes aeneus]|uniref:Cytochrome-b5 reductase n=1 Tax=Brassicogethes aeneus TaxID=1431903 RepID=A0A9P0BJ09_BRAAE|nr:unnamed protein product [Brassicogethes aeneus]